MRQLKKRISLHLVLLILLTGAITCLAEQGRIQDVTVEEAFKKVNDPSVLWIDIRETNEFASLPKLSFAKHVPLSNFANSFSALKVTKDQTLYIICRSGNRTKRLQHYLLSEGYTDVVNILGGMRAWVKMTQ